MIVLNMCDREPRHGGKVVMHQHSVTTGCNGQELRREFLFYLWLIAILNHVLLSRTY